MSHEAEHGGPDGGAQIRVDFSTNAHPLGANPFVLARVAAADRTCYPDPSYAALRERLGMFHGVEARRIVVGGGASELIWRLTHAWRLAGGRCVGTDERTFGEYARAALALGLTILAPHAAPVGTVRAPAVLRWICNPDNPSAQSGDAAVEQALAGAAHASDDGEMDAVVVDLAYQPFRALLTGQGDAGVLAEPWADEVVQLFSPNKLHGLTGVRGAYLVLPDGEAQAAVVRRMGHAALRALAPSWVLGADGVAMLEAHVDPGAREALAAGMPTLRRWKRQLDESLENAGWRRQPSDLHYGLYRPPIPEREVREWTRDLRSRGIKVRDAASFGRPGWVRLRALAPAAVEALIEATRRFGAALSATGPRPPR